MPRASKGRGNAPHLWLIRMVSVFVPRRWREDWRAEWESELGALEDRHREWQRFDREARFDLLRRSFGAWRDALWLQPRRLEDEMMQDLRIGWRALRSQPGFTLVAVLTLALGIGAATLIFSVVNAVLLRPLSFPNSQNLLRVEERHGQVGTSNLTYASFLDLGAETSSIERLAAARFTTTNLTDGGDPESISSLLVSTGYFSTLGISPIIGRAFLAEDDQPGSARVVIISHGLWQRRFGADPNVIGRTIKADGGSATVIGVMPPNFRTGYPFNWQYDLWSPLIAGGSLRTNRRSHLLGVIARLRPGFTPEQAHADLSAIARRIEEQHPGVDGPELGFAVVGLQDRIVAPQRQALLVFLCAVGLLLLIACANVANLLLARATARAREMAIRTALGAGRWRLTRQLLTESALLAGLGGAAGVGLAALGARFAATLDPGNFPRINEVNLDWRVLGFAFFVSLVTGLLFGLAPVMQLPSSSLSVALKEGGRGTAGLSRGWLRRTLVVSEIALALVLLIGAGLLVSSFVRLMQVGRGLDPSNVLTVNLNLPFSKYSTGAQQTLILQRMLESVRTAPGVQSAGLTLTLPFAGGPATDFEIVGRPPSTAGHESLADIRVIDTDYFRTLRIPLQMGRVFSERDTADAPRAMIINQEMARQHWPGENPIGRRVTMKDWGPPMTGEIVGVVGDVKADGLDSETRPMIYWPYPQFPQIYNVLVIRTGGDPLGVVEAVKNRIWAVDREQPLSRIRTMENLIDTTIATRRFNMLLFGVFAGFALTLAAIGVYGVISYTVAQRTHEIGIRLALGARARDVLGLVLKQGVSLALAGIGIGLAASFALTRLMTSLLFGVSAYDPATFVFISCGLLGIALLASFLPARNATRVDPMVALRNE
jgi:putative ABC transport system permease protein